MNKSNIISRLCTTARRCAVLAIALVAGCGGGSGDRAPVVLPPAAPPPPPALTKAQLDDASRFATRASFGLPWGQLEALARQGREAWLTEQFALPVGDHVSIVNDLIARRDQGDFIGFENNTEFLFMFRRIAWWHRTVTADDALRQRVALALSEIFVVSDRVDTLIVFPHALSGYYDTLLNNAFGNYRDLLRAVTLHPAMGVYLSHLNNGRSDPANNIFPDENYAREVMQLFSIGLFELNVDGSEKTDANGQPVATYDNSDIREFAKIFTGLAYNDATFFGSLNPDFRAPMQMFDAFHEPGDKRLLNNAVVPAGQTGIADIDAAIDNLFNHPNVGPFIGRQLIQRLVTSNPSPAYVERVARMFNGEDGSPRGDMQAVLRAVLLDPEADTAGDAVFGKLREPLVRFVSLLRQLGANSADGFIANGGYLVQELGRQHALSAPSVFNFYLPSHAPAGEIAAAGIVAPEFEITDSTSIITFSNLIDLAVTAGVVVDLTEPFAPVSLDLSELMGLADDVEMLLDRLDTMFTFGTLSAETRDIIRSAIETLPLPEQRVRTALYLLLISPDYAVRS